MDEFLTEKELAKRWKINHRTLQAWRLKEKGNYPMFVKIGDGIRYRLIDIEEYEKNNEHTHKRKKGNDSINN